MHCIYQNIAIYRAEALVRCYVEQLINFTMEQALSTLEESHGILNREIPRTLFIAENPLSEQEVSHIFFIERLHLGTSFRGQY